MNIVLIETSGNQRYIFATNKLRENVGASELTHRIGTAVIEEAINVIEARGFSVERILDEPDIGTIINGQETRTQVIIATSGKALIVTSDERIANTIVRFVCRSALESMPGLTVHGAIAKIEDISSADSVHQAVGDVHKRLENIRHRVPSNLQRFQRLPFAAECSSSNLPAERLYVHETVKSKEEERPHSLVSITKQEKSNDGKKRLEDAVRTIEKELHFAQNINDLEKRFEDTKWLAVIHADGNGLGEVFLKFKDLIKEVSGRKYFEKYRKFSVGLDECTAEAAAFALKKLQTAYRESLKRKNKDTLEVPAVPLVLGGDDLTLICDGQYSIKFTRDFLTRFVELTKENEKIKEAFPNGVELGICAGVAIIKPHFPFHQAYSLAEELLQSAKKTKMISKALSALDYHVLYDSSGTTLETIRDKTPFVARPYVVTPVETALIGETGDKKTWVEHHHFDELARRIGAMLETEDGDTTKRKLPHSQLHLLREGLYVGETTKDKQMEVDARARLIAHRYETFKNFYVDDETLFFDAASFDRKENEAETKLTHFLDALDALDFWK